jgi:hypothetical protein
MMQIIAYIIKSEMNKKKRRRFILRTYLNGLGGSRPGKRKNIDRNRNEMGKQLLSDYFGDQPTFGPELFRRRFRMRRELFLRILDDVTENDKYFLQKSDAVGVLGLLPEQKITSALRQLAYGISSDALDEYCRVSSSTGNETRSAKRPC